MRPRLALSRRKATHSRPSVASASQQVNPRTRPSRCPADGGSNVGVCTAVYALGTTKRARWGAQRRGGASVWSMRPPLGRALLSEAPFHPAAKRCSERVERRHRVTIFHHNLRKPGGRARPIRARGRQRRLLIRKARAAGVLCVCGHHHTTNARRGRCVRAGQDGGDYETTETQAIKQSLSLKSITGCKFQTQVAIEKIRCFSSKDTHQWPTMSSMSPPRPRSR